MNTQDLELAKSFKQRLSNHLGARLLDVRAFGSRARGVHRSNSDLDLWVLVDSATPEVRRQVAHLAADHHLEGDSPVYIAPLVVDTQRWRLLQDRERKLVSEIERDGVDI